MIGALFEGEQTHPVYGADGLLCVGCALGLRTLGELLAHMNAFLDVPATTNVSRATAHIGDNTHSICSSRLLTLGGRSLNFVDRVKVVGCCVGCCGAAGLDTSQ